uniref:Uncharacterized protein n=1 Tax=Panagrolaimus sp. JU765 TaxID=591449 RepID=A0AC34RMQ4_9BILA
MIPDYVDIYTPEYTLHCGWHVRKGAAFISQFSLALTNMFWFYGFSLILKYTPILTDYIYYYPALNHAMITCHLFLIFADMYEKPGYYIPYLVFEAINIITIPFVTIFLCFILYQRNDSANVMEIIQVYFWKIIMKAKQYMEKEICTGNVRRQEFVDQMQPIVVVENK